MSSADDTARCGKCLQGPADETQEWVECVRCKSWYHFQCVGVGSEVANTDWVCGTCSSTAKKSSQSTSSSTQSNKQNLNEKKSTSKQSKGQPQGHNTAPLSTAGKATAKQNERDGSRNRVNIEKEVINSSGSTTRPDDRDHNSSSKESANGTRVENTQTELMLAMLEEERKLNQEYIERKYQLLSQMGGQQGPGNISFSPFKREDTLSSSQIAARQAIPKELPSFSGDPEEWPLFISTYENSTTVAGFSDVENMLRLQKSLKGRARELVRDKLLVPSMVSDVIKTLQTFFGRPEHILERLIEKMRKVPPPKDRLDSLIEFALGVRNLYATMEACNMHAHLENPMLVKELIDKLPNQYKLNWAMNGREDSVPVMKSFSDWIYKMAEAASTVTSPPNPNAKHVNTHTEQGDQNSAGASCVICKKEGHRAAQCEKFKSLSIDERWKATNESNLCRQCLKVHKGRCFSRKECGVDGCKLKHHNLLHRRPNSTPPTSETATQGVVSTHRQKTSKNPQLFRIIPLKLHNGQKSVDVFAFLDEGSSVTIIDEKVFEELGVAGITDRLCLQWANDMTRTEDGSVRSSIQVSAVNSERKYWLNDVRSVSNLTLPRQTIDAESLQQKYNHLLGLPIASYVNAVPSLLIGSNNWKLAVPRKIREGSWREPIATKCMLGWAVQGAGEDTGNAFVNIHNCSCNLDEMHEAVKHSFTLESIAPKTLISADEAKALEILNRTCKKRNGKFEAGLLWSDHNHTLPNSHQMALKRSLCLKQKIRKDPTMKAVIEERIGNLLSKGYARKITDAELQIDSGHVWYLPIFVTTNPNKSNKARLVWDAAARVNGKSLNDFLLSGPDLLKPLNSVLLAFRIGKVAVCGDIAEMFHRIDVNDDDMHAQRFLWWHDSDEDRPSIYVMKALTFGIKCAPCIAHYVRNKNAELFAEEYPRACEAINEAHYVDDFIDSADSEGEALKLAEEVRKIHSDGGFTIRNWASNSAEVVNSLQSSGDETQAPVTMGSAEKVLGLYWDPNEDIFKFLFRFAKLKRDVLSENLAPTKREILQVLMSVFDPLGFLSPYTIGLKILIQRVWLSGCNWDDTLPQELHLAWQQWKNVLRLVEGIEVPRRYSDILGEASACVQLHVFVDASDSGYAAACYLRVQHHNRITVSLVTSKSKVAPLKPLSIPRMELQAAVIGVRLVEQVTKTRNLKINRLLLWSDSKTVLRWLRMDLRRFQPYVMHRIGEIIEVTNVSQWRWVPTKCNAADLATKIHSNINNVLWFAGPDFLRKEESEWPTCTDLGDVDQTEVRQHLLHARDKAADLMNVGRFSDWRKLYRTVATVLLCLSKLKAAVSGQSRSQILIYEFVERAKTVLYKEAQREAYYREICTLSAGQQLERQSPLRPLNPYVDKNGVLRAQGRANSINCDADAIILPRKNHISTLIVKKMHESLHHTSHETAINLIRSKFYIARLRILFRAVRNACQKCKNERASPDIPQMAPIPAARLASFERPFTFVGVDYFGPIMVTVGRHKEKRWGVLYTCLTVRAVHIEVASTLDTSSCIICLQNFIARRGCPREIFSDNGTNFKSSAKTVTEELKNLNVTSLEAKFESVKWRFNPPSSPHMGGAWERLIRSVKSVLAKLCPSQKFTDETLRGSLCEVEFILNARPLTFVSLESGDDDALTPNHLLLGSADWHIFLPDENSDLRLRYRQTQLFADHFWRRWIREYAPTLLRRGKWFTKRPPIRVGDVVIVVDETLARNYWPKGIVIDTIVAKDGQVRRATVRTQHGVMVRPVAKLAILDVGVK